MPHNQHVHAAGDPAYASPVLRPPSPATSVGTAYAPDTTTETDTELSEPAFSSKYENEMGLGKMRAEESEADLLRLLPRPKTTEEEHHMVANIMHSLREQVIQLEQNELLEQTLLRDSQAALELLPSSNDINAIMLSIMNPPSGTPNDLLPSSGPWNSARYRYSPVGGNINASTGTAGRHKTLKGKAKSRML